MRLARYEQFAGDKHSSGLTELLPLIDDGFIDSQDRFLKSVQRAIQLSILGNNLTLELQLSDTIPQKLDRLKRGTWNNFSSNYDAALVGVKDALFDDSSDISQREKRLTLDFLLDFALVTGVCDYTIDDNRSGRKTERAMQVAYLIALQFAAEQIIINLFATKKLRHRGVVGASLVATADSLGKKIRDVSSYDDLSMLAVASDYNGQASGLKKSLEDLLPRLESRKFEITGLVKHIMETAELLYGVAQQSILLSHLYHEFALATASGYESRFKGVFTAAERSAEKVITSITDILAPILGKGDKAGGLGLTKDPREKTDGLILIRNPRALIDSAKEFAYHRPKHVVKGREGYNNLAGFIYVPLIGPQHNQLTYTHNVANHMRDNRHFAVDLKPENKFLADRRRHYVSRKQKGANIFFTAHVAYCREGHVRRGAEPDIERAIIRPMRYALFNGSSTDKVAAEAEDFRDYLRRMDIAAVELSSGDITSILMKEFGLKQDPFDSLKRIGALSRASPVFDLVAEFAVSNPGKYGTVVAYKQS